MTDSTQSALFTPSSSNPSIVDSNRILYTASPFARSSLLHLQEIGELRALKPHQSARSGLNSYLFFTVLSGSGSLTYSNAEYKLEEGSCVFIDCNIPYSHATDPTNLWTLHWIHFNGTSMASIYDKYCERGGRVTFSPNPDKMEEIGSVWKEIMDTASSDDYMRDMLINQQLSTLLTLIMSESWHPEDQENLAPKKSLIVSVKNYLDQNYESKITLDQLSRDFYINKYYLTKTFKAQYGVSINNYLLSVRITKAKQLLRFSDKTVEEIGLECGLGSAQYFSSKFKEIEGVSPSVYREQW